MEKGKIGVTTENIFPIIKKAPEHGLLLDYFLFCDEAFRIAPPLTVTPDEITLACRRLGELLDEVSPRN